MNKASSNASMRLYELSVVSVQPLSDDSIALRLDAGAHRHRFGFLPGQYLTLEIDVDGIPVRRPYSISSIPDERLLEVGIRRVAGGRFSVAAALLKAGDRVRALPPQGRFTLAADTPADSYQAADGKQLLLIAAGSGITPCLSIARSTLAGDSRSRVILLYGNRTLASMMYRDALADLKDRFTDRLMIDYLLSREEIHAGTHGRRIDATYLEALHEAGQLDVHRIDAAFVCGPGTLPDTVTDTLGRLGFPGAAIRQERFLPAPDASSRTAISDGTSDAAPDSATAGSSVSQTATTERRGRVTLTLDGFRHRIDIDPHTETVLGAAQRQGLELPYSCAGGMCCTCRCRVIAGEVSMAVNYSLQPWELEQGYVLACQARSLGDELVLDFDAQ